MRQWRPSLLLSLLHVQKAVGREKAGSMEWQQRKEVTGRNVFACLDILPHGHALRVTGAAGACACVAWWRVAGGVRGVCACRAPPHVDFKIHSGAYCRLTGTPAPIEGIACRASACRRRYSNGESPFPISVRGARAPVRACCRSGLYIVAYADVGASARSPRFCHDASAPLYRCPARDVTPPCRCLCALLYHVLRRALC